MTLQWTNAPAGLFIGQNFMTPRIIGYVKLKAGLYAELSQGEGMSRQPIFGVTVRPDDEHKLSKGGYQSRQDAEEYIEELIEGVVGDTVGRT